jgi:hydrogenase expression/formation protein HypE
MAITARSAGVDIVTGDFKVVERGNADKLFINTSGIGIIEKKYFSCRQPFRPGDCVIVSGTVGEHGLAIMLERQSFEFTVKVKSDCQPLHKMTLELVRRFSGIRFMRDVTRGGLAGILNEIVEGKKSGIFVDERKIPVLPATRNMCEILGIDPLFLANEGKIVVIADKRQASEIVGVMRRFPFGRKAGIIGEVVSDLFGKVCMRTAAGGTRIIDRPVGDVLPRIC